MAFEWSRFAQASSVPLAVVYVLASLFFSSKAAPRFKLASAWLTAVVVLYNVLCVVLSAVSLYGFGRGLLAHGALYGNDHVDPAGWQEWGIGWGFTVYRQTKYLELLDTLWMVLKGNRRQITFLHVFHHSTMLVLADVGLKEAPFPSVSIILMLNSLVHVFMYTYYAARVAHLDVPDRIKRAITELQLAQFFIGLLYSAVGRFVDNFCVYSLLYGFSMTALFLNFYVKAYMSKKDRKPSDKKA